MAVVVFSSKRNGEDGTELCQVSIFFELLSDSAPPVIENTIALMRTL